MGDSTQGEATPQRTSQASSQREAPGGSYVYEYPRPAVTVDVVLFAFLDHRLQVLLVRRRKAPFADHWALPGGFVGIREGLEEAALRELEEETGVHDVYLEQLYTFGDPDRDPRGRVITVAYFGLVSADQVARMRVRGGDDAADARWWDVYHLPRLAFDHDRIIAYALRRLRWKLEWTALGFLLLPDEFTLSELQVVYETVLNEPLDKRNFRRKILAAAIVEETGRYRQGEHRPAKLYRFAARAVELERARRRSP